MYGWAARARVLPLPPTSPPCWWHTNVRLGRDHYVRVDTCDYSIHPRAIGRKVAVVVTTEEVIAYCDGQVVARRPRCWARHQTLTDAEYAAAAAALRGAFRRQPDDARDSGPDAAELVEVEQRRLEVYDRAFTVIDGGGEGDGPHAAEVS